MSFDVVAFLDRHGINKTFTGPNVGRGEVAVKCPFCGPADSSEHLSINLHGMGWVCRRERKHRGRSYVPLVKELIGCSFQEAARIVGRPVLPAGDLLADVEAMLGGKQVIERPAAPLRELPTFKKFEGKPSEQPYLVYMQRRGFKEKFIRRASRDMGLRYCTQGLFGTRIIFLVHQEGRLVNWTGRAISPHAKLRYRALSPDPEIAREHGMPAAAMSIERCLLWYDELLNGGELLELVEGPMDALKLRSLGHMATCLFTNRPSRQQIDLLHEIAPRFERRVILLDKGAEGQALQAAEELAALKFRVGWLPHGVDDPGELDEDSVSGIT